MQKLALLNIVLVMVSFSGSALAQLNIGMFLKNQSSSCTGTIVCGTNAGDNCYTGSTSAAAQTAGYAKTPGGKCLKYVFADGSSGFKVWQEESGTRILRATGLDAWTKALNPDGISVSTTDFTDANLGNGSTLINGRVCPTNVYMDTSNKFTTGNCLYYSPGYGPQRLDAGGTDGILGLGQWSTTALNNGNIATCSNKSMRLPTLYETTASDPGYGWINTGGSPTGWGNGIPQAAGATLTATAYTPNAWYYWGWSGTTPAPYHYFDSEYVRCVVP